MNFFIQRGFFGSDAPFFIDLSLILFFLFPAMMTGAIFLAKKELIGLHITTQLAIFAIATITLVLDVSSFNQIDIELKNSIIFYGYIIFLSITYIIWYRTIYFAIEDSRRMALPGLYSKTHKEGGKLLIILVMINPILGTIAYYFNFIN